ncbi:DUF4163 domain-containing protein [Deinococcus cellulosilyticus]|uniref:DUF3298 domain-containing protein n=1 Tax=Deinococcus cellulosilyticus (strain DSM 18568 / NBRC 106333 / KACC 11606 / 5516J-15) TaxID=1223518 RepID=A0A511MZS3_DEIC1|nr:DUF4163 domain-containing protein [Deinococcus cellulosilyticus]GEM46120.1 hypothetical protein DC3_17550 [Deinococcus cellulosilyticus NBRC 106333 = KACC 11606]
MFKRILLALALTTTPTLAQVYQGSIGTYSIVMQLEKDLSGKYAYLSKGLSLELKGQQHQGTLTLTEQVFDREKGGVKTTGTFQLKSTGQGYTGTWKAPGSAKSLQVQLKPVPTTASYKLPVSSGLKKLQQEDPYNFTLLNHPWVKLKDGTVQEPFSKVEYPRLTGRPQLNLALQDLQLQEAAYALDCLSMGEGFDGAEWDSRTRVTLQNTVLYSIRTDTYMYCGGAHPDTMSTGHVFDLKTGRKLTLSAFWDKLTPSKQRALYMERYVQQADPDCVNALQGETSDTFEWTLTPKGLALWPNFLPHVMAACGEEVILPYSALKAYARSGSVYLKTLR